MKKSLIALLVATLPAAAFADVTIYGKIKGGIEAINDGDVKQTNFDDLGSRIGFKGSEDLGNGLKAIWQVETGFGIDTGAGTGSSSGSFANRNSFIGLQGGWGTIRLGNVTNYMDSNMDVIDPWEYNDNALGLGNFTRGATRLKNSIRYDIPNVVPGLTAALQYGTNEERNLADSKGGGTDRETTIFGIGYENSGFFGHYAYQHQSAPSLAAAAYNLHRLDVGYNANNWLAALGYRNDSGEEGLASRENKLKTKEIALSVAYTFGAITPKFTYAHGWNAKVGGVTLEDTKYDQFVLGLDYALSKRTVVGTQYGQINYSGDVDNRKAFGLNVVHSF